MYDIVISCMINPAKIRREQKRQHERSLQYKATLMEEEHRHDDAVIPDALPAPPPLPVTPPPPKSVNLPPPPAANRAVQGGRLRPSAPLRCVGRRGRAGPRRGGR